LYRRALGGQVLVEEGDELGPKRLDAGIKAQLHGTPGAGRRKSGKSTKGFSNLPMGE
jgi:hypothetical protein